MAWLGEGRPVEEKKAKGGVPVFRSGLKTDVADRRPLKSVISVKRYLAPTLTHQIIRQFCDNLSAGIRRRRPHSCPVLYVTSRRDGG